MRALLNFVYGGCGALAGLFLLLIAVLILAQVVGRMLGLLLPSADEFAGFCMAASTFLALGYTLRAGGHIRVALFIQHLTGGARRRAEILCLGVGVAISGYFAWYILDMAWESYVFGDLAQTLIPTPLWIPQAGMAVGAVVLFIGLVDSLQQVLRGLTPPYQAAEADDPLRTAVVAPPADRAG